MSKLEVDTIAPQSGTTITVGETGDTVDISNATLSANLNANNLTSGTIPDARFPATLPAVDGSNLTNVQIAGGYTVCDPITVTNTDTFALTSAGSPVSPESAANCIVSLNGVTQAPGTSYTISGSNIVFASALSAGSDVIDFITVLGTALNVGTVSDGTIGLNKLSATGTKDATTFLRGDNTFQTVSSYTDSDALSLFNASGSAPVYACRAWVNFNGTGTVAIRDSGNVSSITDNGTGNYTVNFTTAMSDVNYFPAMSGGRADSTSLGIGQFNTGQRTTSSVYLFTSGNTGGALDYNLVGVAIFR